MVGFLNFLIRWRIISKKHPRLGSIYFWSFLLIPASLILAIASALLYDQSNQQQYLILFYICIAIFIISIVSIFLIEMYIFLSWLKRIF